MAGERGPGLGTPQPLFPPRAVPPCPALAPRQPPAPALQPISGLPGALIIFMAGGSQGAGCEQPGAGTAGWAWGLGGGVEFGKLCMSDEHGGVTGEKQGGVRGAARRAEGSNVWGSGH